MKKKMISAFALILALSAAVRAQEAPPCPRRTTERNAVRRPNKGETSTKVRIDEKSGSPYFF